MPRKKHYKYGEEGFHDYCVREGLPYVEKDTGKYRNTHHFCEVGQNFLKQRMKYTPYPRGSKGYRDFWTREIDRCINGVRIGEMYVSGYYYFFLNYHIMVIPNRETGDEEKGFASFWKIQYDLFNIVDYCQKIKMNLALIKPRGCGLSECAASMGARDYAVPVNDRNGNRIHRNILYLAYDDSALTPDGVYSKCSTTIDHLNKYTAFDHAFITKRDKDPTTMVRHAGWKDAENKEHPTGGKVTAQVMKKADNIRGQRTYLTLWEESGANPVLAQGSKVALDLSRRGGIVTGIHLFWGTSNADTKGVDAFKSILYNPSGTYCIRFKNVWENEDGSPIEDLNKIPYDPRELIIPEDSSEDGVGWFIPAYEADLKFTDKDGNPDRDKAFQFYMKERAKSTLHVDAEESNVNLLHADHPFTMSEALYKESSNQFNVAKLSEQYQNLVVLKKYPKPKRGRLEWIRDTGDFKVKGVKFVEDKKGHLFVLEEPLRNIEGDSFKDLYIGGVDSIDTGIDNSQVGDKGSKYAALIFKRMYGTKGNMPVAYYLERPSDERIAYEETAKLLTWYQCKANIEATRTNVITYFREKRWSEFLYPRPRIAETDMLSNRRRRKGVRTQKVGTPGHEKYTIHGINLIAQYVEDFYDFILFEELLLQLYNFEYTKKGKFDLIAAFAMCLIADEDMMETVIEKKKEKKPVMKLGFYKDSAGIKRYGYRTEESTLSPIYTDNDLKVVDYFDKNGEPVYKE